MAEYAVGSRDLPWWLILFSIIATETSSVTFLSIPGFAYASNLTFLQLVMGYMVGRLVISAIFIPAYFKGELLTVYQLLGGASRDGVLVYGHANGENVEDAIRAVAHYLDMGYKAIRVQSGIPGIASTYGVGRGKLYYEPAERGTAPVESRWSVYASRQSPVLESREALESRFEAARQVYGDAVPRPGWWGG